jgi:hypothetical protein
MKPFQSKEQIEEMRRRLYDRSGAVESTKHKLSDIKVDVARDWSASKTSREDVSPNGGKIGDTNEVDATSQAKPKKRYRTFILIGSLILFTMVALVSTLVLYFGGNQISNDNIQIVANGPKFIGGGEEYAFQVAVSNQNSVPIESATLIVNYPSGTRSLGEDAKNLFEERIPIDSIVSGEVKNIPIKVSVFGEENADKTIKATVEYRVTGSNGMFYKEAEPLVFNVISSPLVLRVDNIEKVASGQLVNIKLTAVSNSSTPIKDLLVSASYPNSFNYESSNPKPIFGQNVWLIDEIMPEEEISIELEGIVTGQTDEDLRINFSAGPRNSNNQFLVGAVLAESRADFLIERPFIDLSITVDGDSDGSIILSEGVESTVKIELTNTLDETVYDLAVEVLPGGNALTEDSVESNQGFFDSNRGTVRWEVTNNSSFEKVLPGDSRSLQFKVNPGEPQATASYNLDVNVYARRVTEESAQETLIGTTRVEVKYSSVVNIGSQATLLDGPQPPMVGEETEYLLTIIAEAGVNDVTDAIVETSLPLYVEWGDDYSAPGEVTYNTVTKKLEWDIGNIDAGERKELNMKVGIQPSLSQFDTEPVLLNRQLYRANDRFTGALLQDSAPAVTTELSTEMGLDSGNGTVIR